MGSAFNRAHLTGNAELQRRNAEDWLANRRFHTHGLPAFSLLWSIDNDLRFPADLTRKITSSLGSNAVLGYSLSTPTNITLPYSSNFDKLAHRLGVSKVMRIFSGALNARYVRYRVQRSAAWKQALVDFPL